MSHRGDLTARMVELSLLLAERPYSQAELACHFGVNRKTVKRAIDAISLHYPVEEDTRGREARYCFSEDYKFTPPTLTPSELATLLLSQEAIAATHAPNSPFAEHARRLLMKVRNALPSKLRDKLDALASVYGSAVIPAKDFTAHAATIDELTDAAILRRQVRLKGTVNLTSWTNKLTKEDEGLLPFVNSTDRLSSSSSRHLNAAHLAPRRESQLHLCPVALGCQQMPSWFEVRCDD